MHSMSKEPDLFQDVADFHRKFARVAPKFPQLLGTKQQLYQLARMLEELHEFQRAYLLSDLPAAADALADLMYFTLGTAHRMGLPFNHVWSIVHTANMAKQLVALACESKYDDPYDIIKPPGWQSPTPQISRLLEDIIK